jgi:hypothetical protein
VCDLETSRMGAPYIYDISRLRVKRTLVMACHCRKMRLSLPSFMKTGQKAEEMSVKIDEIP